MATGVEWSRGYSVSVAVQVSGGEGRVGDTRCSGEGERRGCRGSRWSQW